MEKYHAAANGKGKNDGFILEAPTTTNMYIHMPFCQIFLKLLFYCCVGGYLLAIVIGKVEFILADESMMTPATNPKEKKVRSFFVHVLLFFG